MSSKICAGVVYHNPCPLAQRGHVVVDSLQNTLISSHPRYVIGRSNGKRGAAESRGCGDFCLLPLRQRQPSFDLSKPVLATEKCTQK